MLSSGRLPDTFARDVLKRVSLYPIKDGTISWENNGLNDTAVVHMGSSESPFGMLFLTMPMADTRTMCRRDSFMDELLASLVNELRKALKRPEADISEFVLYPHGNQLCHAEAVFGRGQNKETISLRVGDAILLSFRKRIPILAHEDLVRAGKAGTDEREFPSDFKIQDGRPVMAPNINMTALLDMPYRAGFLPQDSEDGVCYHTDPSAHTLLITVPRIGWSTDLRLDDYLLGLGKFRKFAQETQPFAFYRDDYGHLYRLHVSADQDTLTVYFTPCEEKDITPNAP
jgi:hypothetical protein